MKQKLTELQGETHEFTIVAGDFNTPLSKIGDRSNRHKISKNMELNNIIN